MPKRPGPSECSQGLSSPVIVADWGGDPDACLINQYIPGAKLSLHRDRGEKDAWAPIVSVSLGLLAVFLWAANAAPI